MKKEDKKHVEKKEHKKESAPAKSTEEKKDTSAVVAENYIPRLKTKYQKEIVPALQKEFNFKSPMRAPRLEKIDINQGVGDAVADRKNIDSALSEMTIITGQKPMPTLSKKDISNFKLRKGVAVGVKVTLRAEKMYEFLDRFIATALPRIRDFRG
ncbi:MAG: 50S ribosomal protein L5, partial [Bacteroidota bacterium]